MGTGDSVLLSTVSLASGLYRSPGTLELGLTLWVEEMKAKAHPGEVQLNPSERPEVDPRLVF